MRTGPVGCCCMPQGYREAPPVAARARPRGGQPAALRTAWPGGGGQLGLALLLVQLAQLLFLELAPRFLLLDHLLVRPLLELGGLRHRVEREAAELRRRGSPRLLLSLMFRRSSLAESALRIASSKLIRPAS